MGQNVGSTDKIIRVVIAIIFAGIGYYYTLWCMYVISLIILLTAIFGYCGIYSLFGWNTNKE